MRQQNSINQNNNLNDSNASQINNSAISANDSTTNSSNLGAKQGSPRLGRLRGISPQSREKQNYATGNNQVSGSSASAANSI
jgi:hypothetical protein